jgi:DNA helicase IV
MWPLLKPAQLLHDLYGSRALLKLAGAKVLSEVEIESLYRPRSDLLDDVRWTVADAALLDEARVHLGPKPGKGGKIDEADEIRTYGHIVIDEVQDLTPMQLAMVTRRSLSGSMTVVGDLAQATGPHAPATWDDVLDHLPDVKHTRVIGLSVGYRIPGQIMELANRVMEAASPGLRAPTAVRAGVAPPLIVGVSNEDQLLAEVVTQTQALLGVLNGGNVAVVVPDALAESTSAAFTHAGVEHGRATTSALDTGVTIVPVSVVKGLELDGVLVVEPATIVDSEAQGMRSLYVALTRATQRLVVVHARPLPEPMRIGSSTDGQVAER